MGITIEFTDWDQHERGFLERAASRSIGSNEMPRTAKRGGDG
ncbi:hypothetical protein [Natrinema salsiterrestre]|nr:hypothetical protein [Natrinema salsiterrestre]